MGSEAEKEIGISTKFDKKMERPQKAILDKDWGEFKKFFQKEPKAIMEPLDLSGNTAVHVAATRWDNSEYIEELISMLPEKTDRWRALRMGNNHENTVLHQAIHCKNVKVVDAVLNYQDLMVPEDEKEEDKPLLELVNDKGETPVYRAAKYGKLEMLKHMSRSGVTMKNHFYRRQRKEADTTSILHVAIIGQYFEVALWLTTEVEGIDEVARVKDGNGLTCLQLLCGMPSVFRSHDSHMGLVDQLIYAFLPVKGYDESNGDVKLPRQKGVDIESGKKDARQPTSSALELFPQLSLLNFAIRKAIAKEWVNIEEIWNKKKQQMLVEKLADFLVRNDDSWMLSKHAKPRKEVVLPAIQPSNMQVARKKAKLENKDYQAYSSNAKPPISCNELENKDNHNYHDHYTQSLDNVKTPISFNNKVYHTPLLLAASTGIVEIVKNIIDCHPVAIDHVSHDELNILHVTVKHRQKKIYNLLKKYGDLKGLAARMSKKNCTLLHYAANMNYYDGGNQTAGVVYQLRDELHWFQRVKKIIPPAFILYRNKDGLTAKELFELEHSNMLNEAQEWIKGTAQSCSAVAVLVATVVFAAAYTVPGGNRENGIPIFQNSPIFKFFIIMDVIALASSLYSVMMFLSILTSPFQMQEFYEELPQKLSAGFTWLFVSLATTMQLLDQQFCSSLG